MNRICLAVCWVSAWGVAPVHGKAPAHDPVIVAKMHVQGTDFALAQTMAYCDRHAPEQAVVARAAWQQWRQRHDLDAMRRQVPPALLENVRGRFSDATALDSTLAKQGPPAQVCASVPDTLAHASMDMRAKYPAAYGTAGPGPAITRAPTVDDRVRTAPGKGVAPGQVATVMFSGTNARLLLKDGSLYDSPRVPPSDLDVRASRRLEPQRWKRWRKDRTTYLVRDGTRWVPMAGWAPVATWASAPPLAGEFVKAGSGAVSLQPAWRFGRDGRFETSVPQPGTDPRKSDGQHGSFRTDGYTLELRYDSGEVVRVLSFPWSGDGDGVFIHGQTYTTAPPRPQPPVEVPAG